MGRSTSVYFFCLAMDPIFVALNQTPRVFVVAGYVDDTTVVGHQEDAQWVEEVFKYVKAWTTAGIVMDIHDCWQVGFSSQAENTLLKVTDVWRHVTPIHDKGQATRSAALQLVPCYARHFVLRHGDHCIHMSSTDPEDAIRRPPFAMPVSSEPLPMSLKDATTHQCRIFSWSTIPS